MASNRNGKTLAAIGVVITILIATFSAWVTVNVSLAATQTKVEHHDDTLKEIKIELKEINHTVQDINLKVTEIKATLEKKK